MNNSQKPPYRREDLGDISQKLSNSPFCLKFHCHGDVGQLGIIINGTVKLTVPDYFTLEPNRKCIR